MLRMLHISDTNWLLVTALLFESMKNGPELSPRMAIKLSIAATGQSMDPVQPTIMSDPTPNWSDFDFFRWICNIRGFSWLSTAMSPQAKQLSQAKKFKKGTAGDGPEFHLPRVR